MPSASVAAEVAVIVALCTTVITAVVLWLDRRVKRGRSFNTQTILTGLFGYSASLAIASASMLPAYPSPSSAPANILGAGAVVFAMVCLMMIVWIALTRTPGMIRRLHLPHWTYASLFDEQELHRLGDDNRR